MYSFIEFFFVITFAFQSIKCIKGLRGALTIGLSLRDVNILLGITIVYGLLTLTNTVLSSLFIGFLCFYLFLYWLDAILFVQYKIEINYQTLTWFLKGSKGLLKGVPHLLSVFKYSPSSFLIPFIFVSYLYSKQLFYALAILVVSLFLIKKTKGINILILLLIGDGFFYYCSNELQYASNMSVQMMLFLTSIVALVGLNLYSFLANPNIAFFSLPTTILSCFFSGDLKFFSLDVTGLPSQLKDIIFSKKYKQRKSEQYSNLQGANIILITMESLGAYIEPYQDLVKLKLVERIKNNAWISDKHFCLCPNTTVSTNQIYTGEYSNNPYNKLSSKYWGAEPKHIHKLKSKGYKTLFLDSADINLYDYSKLLKRIGFDKIWGSKDLLNSSKKGDYRLLDMVDSVVEEIGEQPFFLHIINDQTHMPYEVIDKSRFNRHKGGNDRATYLNAIEEVDYILNLFLDKMEQKLDLSNTIIVLTGDHGESFGEYGYHFHSNSIVKEQVQVPMLLSHPKLLTNKIAHSCHFDLFPTFFDLLGIDYDYETCGQSIALTDRQQTYFFHSATLKANTPANFGIVMDRELCWVDRLFSQIHYMDIYTNRKIRKEDALLDHNMVCQALKSRHLMENVDE